LQVVCSFVVTFIVKVLRFWVVVGSGLVSVGGVLSMVMLVCVSLLRWLPFASYAIAVMLYVPSVKLVVFQFCSQPFAGVVSFVNPGAPCRL